MGTVIAFPVERRPTTAPDGDTGPGASIVILPVIRIERYGEGPDFNSDKAEQGTPAKSAGSRRRRRRRSSRS